MSPLRLRLRELRDAAGLSQRELAAKAGIRAATIADIERGTGLDPRLSTLEKMADALGVELSELIEHTPPKGRR